MMAALAAPSPPASADGLGAWRRPASSARDRVPPDALGRDLEVDAGVIERQLVDHVAVDHERALDAERM